jgi:hypothetical protein
MKRIVKRLMKGALLFIALVVVLIGRADRQNLMVLTGQFMTRPTLACLVGGS